MASDSDKLPSATEQLKLIRQWYDELATRFDADERTSEAESWAWACWAKWPYLLGLIGGTLARAGKHNLSSEAVTLRRCFAKAHKAATHWLMREAERRGVDSSPLAGCLPIVTQLILSTDPLPGDDDDKDHDYWPGCLGNSLYEFPEASQQAILEANATFGRLVAKLEIDLLEAVSIIAVSATQKPNPIPADKRTKPMTKKAASRHLGRKGDEGRAVEWLNKCVADGIIQYFETSRQSGIYNVDDFAPDKRDALRP